LKKNWPPARRKNLSLRRAWGVISPTPQARIQKVFLLLFLQKKKRLPYLF
jgi:hypothetical protein